MKMNGRMLKVINLHQLLRQIKHLVFIRSLEEIIQMGLLNFVIIKNIDLIELNLTIPQELDIISNYKLHFQVEKVLSNLK